MSWTDLGSGIRVRQSRVFWMNSVLLSHPEHSVVFDPGVLPSEMDDLARATGDAARVTLVMTHGDWDHVLGKPWWPEARVVAHDRFAPEVRERREEIGRAAREATEAAGEPWDRGFEPFRPDDAVSGLHFDRLGPWRVVYRDAPGHSASMLSIHLPEHRVLIAGDMLSDIEIPMLEQPIALYRETLLALAPLAEHGAIETLIPGHGSIAQGPDAVLEHLRRDLGYLDELERRVRFAREQGVTLEQTQVALAEMSYSGKGAAYSMDEYHRANVARVHTEMGTHSTR